MNLKLKVSGLYSTLFVITFSLIFQKHSVVGEGKEKRAGILVKMFLFVCLQSESNFSLYQDTIEKFKQEDFLCVLLDDPLYPFFARSRFSLWVIHLALRSRLKVSVLFVTPRSRLKNFLVLSRILHTKQSFDIAHFFANR